MKTLLKNVILTKYVKRMMKETGSLSQGVKKQEPYLL